MTTKLGIFDKKRKSPQIAGLEGIIMDLGTILAITISAIALLSTIIGPMITASITCRHEERMYKKRFLTEHEHEAIERYLRIVGRYVFGKAYDDQKDLGEAFSEIYMYVPRELWGRIQLINDDIVSLLDAKDNEERKKLTTQLRESYLLLCEHLAPLRRSDEKKQKHRSKKNNK